MKLGTLLLRDAVISLAQLETALRTQVLYGGRLGTNLVELGFLDLDRLGRYLGQVHGVPVATKERLDAVPRAVVEAFDVDLADLYTAFPLGFEPDHPDTLAIAVTDPSDPTSLDQLAAQCEHPIAPYVAPELRVFYYLEREFGLSRKARFVRTGTRRAPPAADHERRRAQPAGGIELPPALRFEPRGRPASTPPPVAAAVVPEAQPIPRVSFDEIAHAIDGAETRTQIGDALIEYAVGRFEAAVLFILRDSNALGWRFYSSLRAASREAVEHLALPLGGSSVLQACFDSHAPYQGPALSVGRPVEKKLWETIGAAHPPDQMLVVPVLVKARVVNLVYVHAPGGGRLDERHAGELVELCRHAASAYVKLIRSTKAVAAD